MKTGEAIRLRRRIAFLVLFLVFLCTGAVHSEESLLVSFEKGAIWKVDRPNHRCLIEGALWDRFPFEKKEQILQLLYVQEKTWWKISDRMSGKLLGEVNSWGWKIYP